jgi:hypothetical protein
MAAIIRISNTFRLGEPPTEQPEFEVPDQEEVDTICRTYSGPLFPASSMGVRLRVVFRDGKSS